MVTHTHVTHTTHTSGADYAIQYRLVHVLTLNLQQGRNSNEFWP